MVGLRKDPVTGTYILEAAKAIQKNRAGRRKYARRDLRPPKLGLIAWLTDLLSFRGDPFSASPIASPIGKLTRLVKHCLDLVRVGKPITADHFIMLSLNERLEEQLADADARADHHLDALDTAVRQEEKFLDLCRPENIQVELEAKLDDELGKIDVNFGPLARRAGARKVNLKTFQKHHGLPKTFHWGENITTGSVALIMLIMLVEFMLNSVFFAETNPMGLIGGVFLAFLLSIATMALGGFLGVSYQYNHPTSEGGGWVGKLLFLAVGAAAVVYLLLLTHVRLAGESGDANLFKSAAQSLQDGPFSALLNLPALAYFFFSITIITGVAYEYIKIMGRFPGLRKRVMEAEHSETAYDYDISAAGDHFREIAEERSGALNTLPEFIQHTSLSLADIIADYENAVDQLKDDSASLSNASRLLFGYVNSFAGDSRLDLDLFQNGKCAALVEKHDLRLAQKRAEVELLLNHEEIKPSAIDRSRKAMNAKLQSALAELKERCTDLKETAYRTALADHHP